MFKRWMLVRRGEDGFALITGVIGMFVVLLLSYAVIELSFHNSRQSENDRNRTEAIEAAEAGVDAYLATIPTSGSGTCGPIDANLSTTPATSYHVTISFYSSYPPSDNSLLTCPLTTPAAAALVVSSGTTVSTGPYPVKRTMESLLKLAPSYGGLTSEIYSEFGLNLQNKLIDNGFAGHDGDVYTDGDFTMANNTSIDGNVYAQGNITINQGIVKADTWAGGNVSLTAISVFGRALASSATSTLSLASGAHVYGYGRAGTTISVSSNSAIDGGTYANSGATNPPPSWGGFPQLPWNPANWSGYTINYFNSCNPAQNFINTLAPGSGNQVVRVQAVCDLRWSGNPTVNLYGNLAIITDGSITTLNNPTFQGVGGRWTIFLIRPYDASIAMPCPNPSSYDLNISNSTAFNNLVLGAYTQCTLNFGNNNTGGAAGQLIGGVVNLTNQMTLNYNPVIFPNAKQVGSTMQIAYLREIVNP